MSAYIVGMIDIEDPERYALYQAGVVEALAPFDFEILSGDDCPEIIEGRQPANHLFIIRFKSSEDFHAFYASDAYRKIVEHRQASSTARTIMIMKGKE